MLLPGSFLILSTKAWLNLAFLICTNFCHSGRLSALFTAQKFLIVKFLSDINDCYIFVTRNCSFKFAESLMWTKFCDLFADFVSYLFVDSKGQDPAPWMPAAFSQHFLAKWASLLLLLKTIVTCQRRQLKSRIGISGKGSRANPRFSLRWLFSVVP